jgi:hypothetical protein
MFSAPVRIVIDAANSTGLPVFPKDGTVVAMGDFGS